MPRAPTYVALAMVSAPTPTTMSVMASSGHSMCATKRRSIFSIAHVFSLVAQLKERFEQRPGRGSGDRSAPSFRMLDEGRYGNSRIIRWCIGDEPGMVALLPGKLLCRDSFVPECDDLCRTRLAGHGDAGQRRVLARPATRVDDVGQSRLDLGQGGLADR